jgi:four helix bundle protein
LDSRESNQPDIVERTFKLGVRIDALCRFLRSEKLVPVHRISQLERSGSAIGALVEEAQGAESKDDFIHKISIALKEARETFYWLRQLMAAKVLPDERLESLTDEARQAKLILAAIVNTARKNNAERGPKGAKRKRDTE